MTERGRLHMFAEGAAITLLALISELSSMRSTAKPTIQFGTAGSQGI